MNTSKLLAVAVNSEPLKVFVWRIKFSDRNDSIDAQPNSTATYPIWSIVVRKNRRPNNKLLPPHLNDLRTFDHCPGMLSGIDDYEVTLEVHGSISNSSTQTRTTSAATTLYSGHIVSASQPWPVTLLTMFSGKWKVV